MLKAKDCNDLPLDNSWIRSNDYIRCNPEGILRLNLNLSLFLSFLTKIEICRDVNSGLSS